MYHSTLWAMSVNILYTEPVWRSRLQLYDNLHQNVDGIFALSVNANNCYLHAQQEMEMKMNIMLLEVLKNNSCKCEHCARNVGIHNQSSIQTVAICIAYRHCEVTHMHEYYRQPTHARPIHTCTTPNKRCCSNIRHKIMQHFSYSVSPQSDEQLFVDVA